MKKGMVSLVGMVIGLVFLFVAFMGPWYTLSMSGGSGALTMNYNVDLYLSRIEVKGTMLGKDISLSTSYPEIKENPQLYTVNPDSITTIETAMILTIVAIVTGIIALVGTAGFVFSKGKTKMMKFLGGGFGILTFILSLVPALYFMSIASTQTTYGFWFSRSGGGASTSAGPGYAWYLMIVAAIIAVISAVAILLKKIETEPIKTEVIAPPTN